ncbi:tetratricopeptide repeat protein [Anabaena sp. UHCC 0187]|uniref:tetratricopeptide repeat protein n=1 Tax=Anabaena sp. UHCC 0187 TaxID=2590018 RepID=UPI001446F326|nr:tetratricopeptide repeat protein [Anabaena sp. UHCC 0187]MDP5016671.1 tetratricopeptide repeat protein [Dolichospermum sp.]MTJ11569.1 tetratricopeptide repeat protein [Anabaena sp. UHCC 0187]
MLQRFILIITTIIVWHLCISGTVAKDKKVENLDKFPPNPLEVTLPDPLLPNLPDKRELTSGELQKLKTDLDGLNQEAQVMLQGEDKKKAFEIWNRELRLRRYLGILAEVEALSRVGEIAWNENEREEVQYISQRLQVIQSEMGKQKSTDLQLWQSLGNAYQKIRLPKLGISVYEQILILVKQQQDSSGEIETLKNIGELHLSWFDYPQAANTYEKLLNLAINQGDRTNELAYLQQLAYIYAQGKQPQAAIDILNKLAQIYTSQQNLMPIPALKLAIAANYESLAQENPNLKQQAFDNYQQAYTTAWQSEQYAKAAEALEKLIAFYRSQKQIDAALQTSQILMETQTLANNSYGLMSAYDQIGEIYLERREYSQALTAFEKGLAIAQQLKYQEAYFTKRIEKLKTEVKM